MLGSDIFGEHILIAWSERHKTYLLYTEQLNQFTTTKVTFKIELLKECNHQVNLVFYPDYAAEEHIHQVYLAGANRTLN